MRLCEQPDCGRKHYSRGACHRHYKKLRKYGDPTAGRSYHDTPEEAFLAYTEPLLWDDHLIWAAALNRGGYAQIWVEGRHVGGHRYAWERANGPIPEGMVIDHLCHVQSCVNVDHLRLATPRQNGVNRRGANKNSPSGIRNVRQIGPGAYRAYVRPTQDRPIAKVFPTAEEAAEWAKQVYMEAHGEHVGGGWEGDIAAEG